MIWALEDGEDKRSEDASRSSTIAERKNIGLELRRKGTELSSAFAVPIVRVFPGQSTSISAL